MRKNILKHPLEMEKKPYFEGPIYGSQGPYWILMQKMIHFWWEKKNIAIPSPNMSRFLSRTVRMSPSPRPNFKPACPPTSGISDFKNKLLSGSDQKASDPQHCTSHYNCSTGNKTNSHSFDYCTCRRRSQEPAARLAERWLSSCASPPSASAQRMRSEHSI